MSTTFAASLKTHRERAGLSQSALGRAAGMNHSVISYYESGGKSPKRDTVLKLAIALDLDDDDAARLAIAAGYWPQSWSMRVADDLLGRRAG